MTTIAISPFLGPNFGKTQWIKPVSRHIQTAPIFKHPEIILLVHYRISYPIISPALLVITITGLEHLLFSICWESYSQLTFIFSRGVGQPPTR
jgi:hypothetical protein